MDRTEPVTGDVTLNRHALNADVPCVQCGYNLRGLSAAVTCPECATPITESLPGDGTIQLLTPNVRAVAFIDAYGRQWVSVGLASILVGAVGAALNFLTTGSIVLMVAGMVALGVGVTRLRRARRAVRGFAMLGENVLVVIDRRRDQVALDTITAYAITKIYLFLWTTDRPEDTPFKLLNVYGDTSLLLQRLHERNIPQRDP